jgi:DNA excision repair protein ERCC-3
MLSQFKFNPNVKTIFISKVGDTSIDLPEATVIIQISSHFGSRRQEAQRLGRILRPKPRLDFLGDQGNDYNAFFYSLVSVGTEEIAYSSRRQKFLINQGYTFKVIPDVTSLVGAQTLIYSTLNEQRDLLATVLARDETDALDEILPVDTDDVTLAVKRKTSTLAALAGGVDFVYEEFHSKRQKVRLPGSEEEI